MRTSMQFKSIVIIMVTVLCCLAISGCGGNTEPDNPAPAIAQGTTKPTDDWKAFTSELSTNLARGASTKELVERFQSMEVVWIGRISMINRRITPESAFSIELAMSPQQLNFADGSTFMLDRLFIWPTRDEESGWGIATVGETVKFRTTLRGDLANPVIEVIKGVGPNAGKTTVQVSAAGGELIEVANDP